MKPIQVVLDTNVLYSALRSRNGASFRLMSLLPSHKFQLNVYVPMVLEYEDVLKRFPSELIFNHQEVDLFLDSICAMSNRHDVFYLWRPILRDSGDDLVLELAVKAECQYIITYNKQDFEGVEAFGIESIDAREFLKKIGEIP